MNKKSLLFCAFLALQLHKTSIPHQQQKSPPSLHLQKKNQIPHGILLDYGFDLINFTQFDGILRTNNYIDIKRYNLGVTIRYFDRL